MKTRTVLIIVGAVVAAGLFSGLLAWGLLTRRPDGPIVITNLGQIRGVRGDGDYAKFLGIPYALVDENNPFGAATPHPGFENLFEANEIATPCPQYINGEGIGSIHCLELDIFVPDSASLDSPLPVIVWIHGGAFVVGSTTNEGNRSHWLHSKDVIVVAIHYRLGVYGFLCLDTPEVPGNRGLKDQVLALRWIQSNIAAFGGDPNRITATGGSAGGMSVNLHLYSPYERLFNQAIIQSGSALSYWLMNPSHPDIPFRLATHFGHNANNLNDALAFLATVEPTRVAQAANELLISNANGLHQQPLTKPCVEMTFPGVEAFIPEHPMNVRSPKLQGMNILMGYNDKELGFLYADDDDSIRNNYQFTNQFNMGFTEHEDLEEALETIRHFYIGDEEISKDVIEGIVDYASDIIFGHANKRMIEKLINEGVLNVYSYVFSHAGQRNFFKVLQGADEAPGAIHGDDMGYLFDLDFFPDTPNAEDQLVIDRMTDMWTNFARFGNPTPRITDQLSVRWIPVTNTSVLPHLEISNQLTMSGRPTHARMAFWDIFYRIYGSYQMWYRDDQN